MYRNGKITFERVEEFFQEPHSAALAKIAQIPSFDRNLYTVLGELFDNKMQLWYAHGGRTSCHVLFASDTSLWVLAVFGTGFFRNLQFLSSCALDIAERCGCSDVRATTWDRRTQAAYARVGAVPLYEVWRLTDGRKT